MICPNCKNALPEGAGFCTHCGCGVKKEITQTAPKKREDTIEKPRKPLRVKMLWIGVAALVGVAAVGVGWPRLQYRSLMNRGRALVQEGENWEAIPLLERAAALNPKEEQPYAYLAKAYFATGPANNEKGWDTLAAGRRETGGFGITQLEDWEKGLGNINGGNMNEISVTSYSYMLESTIYLGLNDAGEMEQLVVLNENSTGIVMNLRFEYDPQGRMSWERVYNSPGERVWSYQLFYNEYGQLEEKKTVFEDDDEREQTWRYFYDNGKARTPSRREETYVWEEAGAEHLRAVKTEYQYGPGGKLEKKKTETMEDGIAISTVTKEYDAQERIIQTKSEGEFSHCYEFVYDKDGGLIQVWNEKGELQKTKERDGEGRIVREWNGAGGTPEEYQFDAAGNRAAWIWCNGGMMYYEYTPQGRLIRTTLPSDWKTFTTLFEYDGEGRVTHIKNDMYGECWYEYPPDGGARIKVH